MMCVCRGMGGGCDKVKLLWENLHNGWMVINLFDGEEACVKYDTVLAVKNNVNGECMLGWSEQLLDL